MVRKQPAAYIGYLYKVFIFGFYPVGLNGLEPSTSRLSGVRSNQLSYKPIFCNPYASALREQSSLSRDYVAYDFDLKPFCKQVCKSL